MYFFVEGLIFRGSDMVSGMIQGCSTSTVDMPLAMEIFIHHTHQVILSAQLSARFFQFADDLAMVTAVSRDGDHNRFAVVSIVLQEGEKGRNILGSLSKSRSSRSSRSSLSSLLKIGPPWVPR